MENISWRAGSIILSRNLHQPSFVSIPPRPGAWPKRKPHAKTRWSHRPSLVARCLIPPNGKRRRNGDYPNSCQKSMKPITSYIQSNPIHSHLENRSIACLPRTLGSSHHASSLYCQITRTSLRCCPTYSWGRVLCTCFVSFYTLATVWLSLPEEVSTGET